MNTFATIQKIIDEAAEAGLPAPTYVTVSIHEGYDPSVGFQFGTPYQVEQWACSNDSDLIKSERDGHTTHSFTLRGDEFSAHCYCLVYDNEQVPADVA